MHQLSSLVENKDWTKELRGWLQWSCFFALLDRLQSQLRRFCQLLPRQPPHQQKPPHLHWHSSCPCTYQPWEYRGKNYLIFSCTRKMHLPGFQFLPKVLLSCFIDSPLWLFAVPSGGYIFTLSVLPSYASKPLDTQRPLWLQSWSSLWGGWHGQPCSVLLHQQTWLMISWKISNF